MKQGVEKIGGSAAHRQIGGNTSYGQRSTTMTKSALKKTKKKLAKPEKLQSATRRHTLELSVHV